MYNQFGKWLLTLVSPGGPRPKAAAHCSNFFILLLLKGPLLISNQLCSSCSMRLFQVTVSDVLVASGHFLCGRLGTAKYQAAFHPIATAAEIFLKKFLKDLRASKVRANRSQACQTTKLAACSGKALFLRPSAALRISGGQL